ncbi:MAG TPA: DUF1549 and DUF1553 domain-containing protein [Gemmataceae bacterium]|nr:DUF1549 and DUF1553 domain-containing protein [Gemmataceae bacterium]
MSRFLPALLLVLAAPAARAAEPAAPEHPSYQRHVTALFSRLGCNAGACHGAVRGQNGFRLSLFAADPMGDHDRLLREFGGRRLNFTQPEASLILRKATGQAEHGGGVRLRAGSFEYEVLRRWIADGAPADALAPSHIRELRVLPAEQVARPGEPYRLRVEARFADGSTEVVTSYCSFESLDAPTAAVDPSGQVTPRGVGDVALIVRYRGQPAMARVLVPRPGNTPFPDVTPNNAIDNHVLAKLRRLNLPPAPLADDATFLRRACLDITGELPTPAEVRAFLADTSADKRAKKIDELLARPGHAALWTLKFCDLLKAADFGVYADALSVEQDAPRFQAWVRARLEENTPYDVFVERILLATSREGRDMDEYAAEVKALMEGYGPARKDLEVYRGRKTLDLFWQRRGADGVGGTLQVAHAFLGLRLECAQCHRHPHDVWQQEDLLDFANFFMRVRRVGFEGDNEKRFPDAAAAKKQFDDDAKKLEAEVKKRKDGEGKKLEEDAKKAKADADKLTAEIAKLEKEPKPDAEAIAAKKKELAAAKETITKADWFRQETAEMEKQAKLLLEIGRRLLQAEIRLLPPGKYAKVTSPIGTKESSTFRLLGETEPASIPPNSDPRELVMAWMRRPDNPYFARAIVNRVWAHYFGRGIIGPPDNLSSFNPATHPELLKELCDGFVKNKYDLRWLHRAILNSRTYQQSSTPAAEAAADRANYAYFALRRLPAEVLLDALNSATGTTEKMDMQFYHWPGEMKTVEVPYPPRNEFVSFVLETYGRPKRNAAVQCDCERDGGPAVFQVLALANHPRVWEKIRDPNGRVAKLVKDVPDDGKRVEELFLATVSRSPTDAERDTCLKYLKAAESPEKGLHGVLWSLLNTREFLLQH